jgi:hypothetical protein
MVNTMRNKGRWHQEIPDGRRYQGGWSIENSANGSPRKFVRQEELSVN